MNLLDADIYDAEWLYELRNDESVRAQSLCDRPIGLLEHYKWFIAELERPTSRIQVAWVFGQRVGTIRSSRNVAVYTLSWAVAPAYRGRGIGARMLKEFIEPMKGSLNAIINKNNIASIKVAERAGFALSKEQSTPSAGWDLYTKEQA